MENFTNFAIVTYCNVMTEIKNLVKDSDGMMTYDYIVNHVAECIDDMDFLTDNLRNVDSTGQFLASSARFLASINREAFQPWISLLIESAIDKDRERKYIWSLLEAIWGKDYQENAERLKMEDDNFRRIYKRIYREPADNLKL